MALKTGNKIVWSSWDVIPMPDTVITQVNALGSYQPYQLTSNNRHERPIGNVEIPGVDPSDVDHIKIPGVDPLDVDHIKIPGVDVDIQEPQVIEIVDPKIPQTNPASVELAPVHQVATEVDPMPAIQQVEPELCRSSRKRTHTEKYTPSMSGPQ